MTPLPPVGDSDGDDGVPLWVWLAGLFVLAFIVAAIVAYPRLRQSR